MATFTISRHFNTFVIKMKNDRQKADNSSSGPTSPITILLCGDLMTGRGIDQILPHPGKPTLYERDIKDANGYVALAEAANGSIPKPVDFSYIWGYALDELERIKPDIRIINLETSITKNNEYWKDKEVLYRMNPENISCLTAAKIDCCSLANNHVLDWSYAGLWETLDTLDRNRIKHCGAGRNSKEAAEPAIMKVAGKSRVIVYAFGSPSSGVPSTWAASDESPGVNMIAESSNKAVEYIKERVQRVKKQGDIIITSIHWGSNWGYEIPLEQKKFAHQLIDNADVDIIYGHSSHHVKGIEVYKDKLILYGCGDFLNDYEGIAGFEYFRDDLSLMYFLNIDPATGKLIQLTMSPTRIQHFRVNQATRHETLWLLNILNIEGKKLGTRVELNGDSKFELCWK